MTRPVRARVARTSTLDLTRPRPGATLGRYRLIAPISLGGMGEAWLAHSSGSHGFVRLVVVKLIRPEYANDVAIRERFLEEARIGSMIHHANVIGALDVGEKRGTLYMVLPYVEGVSLAALARSGRVPVAAAVRIAVDALAGLEAAHSLRDARGVPLGLVHQDFTPHNVLVGTDGASRLIDFGVATIRSLTALEDVLGKPGYRSPEQDAGRPVDARSDIFSAGVVVWQALTGGTSREAVPRDVPVQLLEVARRALHEDPARRFPRADAMAHALEQAAAELRLDISARLVRRFVEVSARERIEQLRALASEKTTRPPLLPRSNEAWSQDVTEIEPSREE